MVAIHTVDRYAACSEVGVSSRAAPSLEIWALSPLQQSLVTPCLVHKHASALKVVLIRKGSSAKSVTFSNNPGGPKICKAVTYSLEVTRRSLSTSASISAS
jgi:hypothetical protein